MENQNVETVVKQLFWDELYHFQLERVIKIMEHMTDALGDDVIKVAQEMKIDWREPLKLYMKNTYAIIKKLEEQYGSKVIEILKEYTSNDAFNRGQTMTSNGDTLDDLLKIFGKGGTLTSKTQSEALIRRSGCLVSEVAREIGAQDIMYYLHCYGDPYLVKGINPHISCKHNKTYMQGDACCEYLITMDGE